MNETKLEAEGGQAGGDVTLGWLRAASPSHCLHNYPAGSAWKGAQLQIYFSWRDEDVMDEVSLSHPAALTCSSWISHLCSCLIIKYDVYLRDSTAVWPWTHTDEAQSYSRLMQLQSAETKWFRRWWRGPLDREREGWREDEADVKTASRNTSHSTQSVPTLISVRKWVWC